MLGVEAIIGITLVSAALAAVAQYFYKMGVRKFSPRLGEILKIVLKKTTLAGIALYLLSLLVYLYALGNAPYISFVYPIFASTFIFVLLISKFVLGESVSAWRVAGVFVILIGIVIVSFTL